MIEGATTAAEASFALWLVLSSITAMAVALAALSLDISYLGVSENWGTLFWGPYNKDLAIKVGSLIFGNSHVCSKIGGKKATSTPKHATTTQGPKPSARNPSSPSTLNHLKSLNCLKP